MRIGSLPHEEANDRGPSRQHRMVQRLMLVTLGHVHASELGTGGEHVFDRCDVAGADRVDQAVDRDAIDIGLELRPAVESVRAREHQLCVVEREGSFLRPPEVPLHLGARLRVPGEDGVEQLFRLSFQLIRDRVWVGARASADEANEWTWDELLSGWNGVQPWPGVRALGQKRVHHDTLSNDLQVDSVLSADTEAP